MSGYIRKQEVDQGLEKTDDDSHNSMIADIFLHEDKDKDGFISHEEFLGPKHDELWSFLRAKSRNTEGPSQSRN